MTSDDEAIFLACVLLAPDLIFKASIGEHHFMTGKNRRIFRAMQKCADQGIKIDYISVADVDPEIDKPYMVTISDKVPSAANWQYYETKLIETYRRHKLTALGRKLAEMSEAGDPAELIEMAENELLELGTNGQTRKIQSIGEVLPGVGKVIEQRYYLKGKLPGLGTGLPGLDKIIGGFQDDRYIVVGARPSDGKSALALNMACNIAIAQNTPTGIISAESSNTEIVTRVIASEGHISGNAMMTGLLTKADFTSLGDVGARTIHAPLYLYDAPNVRYTELKSVARQMVLIHKVKVIFVDYIQIIRWEDSRLAIHEQVAAVSRSLKQLARELKIPIVGLSQLKRDSEGREPEMADLDYSKQIEQDADAIIFIYHPRPKKGEDEEQEDENRSSLLLVKKNRDGAKGVVPVVFHREYIKFYEVAKDNY